MGAEAFQADAYVPPKETALAGEDHDLACAPVRNRVHTTHLTSNELADSQAYRAQPEAEAALFSSDEKSHARLLAVAAQPSGGVQAGSIARLEGRHRASGGNALWASVLGANDGLVSILSLSMGVAGATNSNAEVLIAALAGLLAGSEINGPGRVAFGPELA